MCTNNELHSAIIITAALGCQATPKHADTCLQPGMYVGIGKAYTSAPKCAILEELHTCIRTVLALFPSWLYFFVLAENLSDKAHFK